MAAPASFASAVEKAGFTHQPFADAAQDELAAVFARLPHMSNHDGNATVMTEVFGRIDARAALPGLRSLVERWRPDLVLRDSAEFASFVVADTEGHSPRHRRRLPGLVRGWRSSPAWRARWPTSGPAAAWPGCGRRPACRSCRPPSRGRPPSPPVRPCASGTTPRTQPRRHRPCQAPARLVAGFDRSPGVRDVRVGRGRVRAVPDALPGSGGGGGRPARPGVDDPGRGGRPGGPGPLPANVHVEQWWPQADVMPHAAAMVGHGGSGTTLAGLAAGVPMVVVPLFADQPYNAARVEAIGAGIALEGGPAAVAGLADALRQVLDGDWYRAGAARGSRSRSPGYLRRRTRCPCWRRSPVTAAREGTNHLDHGAISHPPRSPGCGGRARRHSAGLSFSPSGQHPRIWPVGEEPARGFRHLNQAVDNGGAEARPPGHAPGHRAGLPGQVDADLGGPPLRRHPGGGRLPDGHHQLPGQRQRQPGDGLPGGGERGHQHRRPAHPRRQHQQLPGRDRRRPQAHPGSGRRHRRAPSRR